MKNSFYFVCLAIAILSASFSCSKDKSSNCGAVAFKVIDLQEVDSAASACSVILGSESQEDEFLIIRSREELLSQLSFKSVGANASCQQLEAQFQNIDFENEILLIGKARVPEIPATLVEQRVDEDCASGKITYKVRYEIGNFTYASFGLFKFGVIIPKPIGGVPISLNISEVDPQ